MTTWLYSSSGSPVAFISGDNVFSRYGHFIGRLEGSEVWHGSYKGEIVGSDHFLYNISKGSVIRGTPGTPGTPGIPGLPGMKGAMAVPGGYRDVELES